MDNILWTTMGPDLKSKHDKGPYSQQINPIKGIENPRSMDSLTKQKKDRYATSRMMSFACNPQISNLLGLL